MSITPDKELLTYLKHCRRLRLKMINGKPPNGMLYAGAEDFVLMHGTRFRPAKLPTHITEGIPGNCYTDAYKLARRYPKKYHYVEGFATHIIPMAHAWCIDKDGTVVDPTWNPIGLAYFGVEIDLCEVKLTRKGKLATVLGDYKREYPALRGVHVLHPTPFFPSSHDDWPKPKQESS